MDEQWVGGAGVGEALIDDPRKGLDVGAAEIGLKCGSLVDGRGLGQGDKQDVSENRITQVLE